MTTKTATYSYTTTKGTAVTVTATATKGMESATRKAWADGHDVTIAERKPVDTLQTVVNFGDKTLCYAGCIASAPAGTGAVAILGNRSVGMIGVTDRTVADAIVEMVADLDSATSADSDWQAYMAAEAAADAAATKDERNHAAINRAMGNR